MVLVEVIGLDLSVVILVVGVSSLCSAGTN